MNFDQLPDVALLQIFDYLPFKQMVRIGGVNKRSYQISASLVAKLKIFDFPDIMSLHANQYVTPESISALLSLCSNNLEKLSYFISYRDDPKISDIFSLFSYRNLIKLDISVLDTCPDHVLAKILQNSRRLRWLKYDGLFYGGDMGDAILDRLETLIIDRSGTVDNVLRLLMNRVLNLKQLELPRVESDTLDQFLARCPKLESLKCTDLNITNNMQSFWKLDLKELSISHWHAPDDTFLDISPIVPILVSSFQNLEILSLRNMDMSMASMNALSGLTKLRNLTLKILPERAYDRNHIQHLNACKNLEKLEMTAGTLMPDALVAIVNGFHHLNFLIVSDIGDQIMSEEAVHVASLFHRLGSPLTISMLDEDCLEIWRSEAVNQSLKKLLDAGKGEIRIEENICY